MVVRFPAGVCFDPVLDGKNVLRSRDVQLPLIREAVHRHQPAAGHIVTVNQHEAPKLRIVLELVNGQNGAGTQNDFANFVPLDPLSWAVGQVRNIDHFDCLNLDRMLHGRELHLVATAHFDGAVQARRCRPETRWSRPADRCHGWPHPALDEQLIVEGMPTDSPADAVIGGFGTDQDSIDFTRACVGRAE